MWVTLQGHPGARRNSPLTLTDTEWIRVTSVKKLHAEQLSVTPKYHPHAFADNEAQRAEWGEFLALFNQNYVFRTSYLPRAETAVSRTDKVPNTCFFAFLNIFISYLLRCTKSTHPWTNGSRFCSLSADIAINAFFFIRVVPKYCLSLNIPWLLSQYIVCSLEHTWEYSPFPLMRKAIFRLFRSWLDGPLCRTVTSIMLVLKLCHAHSDTGRRSVLELILA